MGRFGSSIRAEPSRPVSYRAASRRDRGYPTWQLVSFLRSQSREHHMPSVGASRLESTRTRRRRRFWPQRCTCMTEPSQDQASVPRERGQLRRSAMQLSNADLLKAYRTMKMIREFEERIHLEFATGDIPGFVHLYAGEEAIAAGVCMHLDDRDKLTSTHRGHGHCIAKGCDVDGMMAEIYGKKDGLCAGKGGSMHIADLSKGMLGANGIVGGGPPLACGAALAAKKLGTGGIAVSFVGDGGANQGTTLESLNLAAIWSLPCIFVVENNGYADATSSNYAAACHDFADRASGFSMPGVSVDGHDFFAVHETAGEAVRRARDGGGPTLIACEVNRYYGHFEGADRSEERR